MDCYLRSGGVLSVQTVAGVYPYTDKPGDVDIPPTLYVVKRQLEECLLRFVNWLPFGGVVSEMSLRRLG